jgi:ribosomal protein S27AE
MSRGWSLSVMNADRVCGLCGEQATAYLHDAGFRCGECHELAPRELVSPDAGGVIE